MRLIAAAVPWSRTLGAAHVSLNGTQYMIVAGTVSAKTGLWKVNLTTGVITEITTVDDKTGGGGAGVPSWAGTRAFAAGTLAGGTRLSNSTSPVVFTVHSTKRRVIAGTVKPSLDVLSAHNLENYALIFSPGLDSTYQGLDTLKLYPHQDITAPAGCSGFPYYATKSVFLQIGTAAASRTYMNKDGTKTAQVRWVASDTSVAPYNASPNYCILLTMASAQNGDQASVKHAATAVFGAEQIDFMVESTPAAFTHFTLATAIDIANTVASGAISTITAATPPVITTGAPHGMSSANNGTALNAVFIAPAPTGFAGGWYYANVTGASTFTLYSDQALTAPVVSTSAVVGGALWDNAPRYTVYDPASTDATLAQPPIVSPFDLAGSRQMATYGISHLPNTTAARTAKYTIFTHRGVYAGSFTMTIFGITSAGAGNGWPAHSEWSFAFRHIESDAESHGFTGAETDGDLVSNCGGPTLFTSGTGSVPSIRIPTSDVRVLYDWRLHIPNPVVSGQEVVYGGLNGLPNVIDLYVRSAEDIAAGNPPSYFTTLNIYTRTLPPTDYKWLLVSNWTTNNTTGGPPVGKLNIKSELYGWGALNLVDRDQLDESIPLPAGDNIAMPQAGACAFANQRSFVGAVKDPSGNYQYGDIYISQLKFPFRFGTIQLSETDATQVKVAGQRIQKFVMTAAAANGASIIYVFTDTRIGALGTAGGNVLSGSGYDSTALSTIVDIALKGTREPGSVVEKDGVILFVDNYGQIDLFTGGMPQSISRNAVDDKTKNIPASMRGLISAAWFGDVCAIAYADTGQTINSSILGWNSVLPSASYGQGEWEFCDAMPTGLSATKVVSAYDSALPGSGQRLIVFSDANTSIYGFEEGTSEPGSSVGPAVALRSGGIQSQGDTMLRFSELWIAGDSQANSLYVDRYYTANAGSSQFRTQFDLTNLLTAKRVGFDKSLDGTGVAATQISPNPLTSPVQEAGVSGFIEISGNLTAATQIERIEVNIEGNVGDAAVR